MFTSIKLYDGKFKLSDSESGIHFIYKTPHINNTMGAVLYFYASSGSANNFMLNIKRYITFRLLPRGTVHNLNFQNGYKMLWRSVAGAIMHVTNRYPKLEHIYRRFDRQIYCYLGRLRRAGKIV